jgi:hypothetical protein
MVNYKELYPYKSSLQLRLRLRWYETTRLGTVELLRSKACIGVSDTRTE